MRISMSCMSLFHYSCCQKGQLSLAAGTCLRVRQCILADASGSCKEHQEMVLLDFFSLALHVACQLKTVLPYPNPGVLLRLMSVILKNKLTKGSVIRILLI